MNDASLPVGRFVSRPEKGRQIDQFYGILFIYLFIYLLFIYILVIH